MSNTCDLVSALVLLSYGLLFTVRRLLGPLNPKHSDGGFRETFWVIFVLMGIVALLVQLYGMLVTGTVSYSDHMRVAIGLAGATSTAWFVWAILGYDVADVANTAGCVRHESEDALLFPVVPHAGKRSDRINMLIFQVCFAMAATMEIFDFPPLWGIFDAHSLWHACTVPLGFVWYWLLENDALNYVGREKRNCGVEGKSK